jgi:2-hydroxy-3-keto-5-methylthiopentenyl-1-phosphate phosphatase
MSELYKDILDNQISRRQAVTDVIESIALEEKGIASILKMEAKKIQKVIDYSEPVVSDIILVNESVCRCLKNLIKLQILLEFKLEEVQGLVDDSDYC